MDYVTGGGLLVLLNGLPQTANEPLAANYFTPLMDADFLAYRARVPSSPALAALLSPLKARPRGCRYGLVAPQAAAHACCPCAIRSHMLRQESRT